MPRLFVFFSIPKSRKNDNLKQISSKMSWALWTKDQKKTFLEKNNILYVTVSVKEDLLKWFFLNRKNPPKDLLVLMEKATDKDLLYLYYNLGADPLACIRQIVGKNSSFKDKAESIRRLWKTFESIVGVRALFRTVSLIEDPDLFYYVVSRATIPYNILDDLAVECIKTKCPMHVLRYLSDHGANPSRIRDRVAITQEMDYALCPLMDQSSD